MGTFAATHSITYENGLNPGLQSGIGITIDDGDADITFEIGDT